MTIFCNTAILLSSLLTSAQAHCPIRKALVPMKLMGPLASQNCPLTSQFSVQYLRDFLTVRIDPTTYKFRYMPGSYSDPSVCTQETAAHLKIHRASHLRCAPGYRRNDINYLITSNPNSNYGVYCLLLTMVSDRSTTFCDLLIDERQWHRSQLRGGLFPAP